MKTAFLRLLLFAGLAPASAWTAEPPNLAFRPDTGRSGFFLFDTGMLRGELRLDGKSQGIETLVHVPTGVEVTYGDGHVGLLSPYRVFSAGLRHDKAARDWPSEPRALDDGSVRVRFPPAPEHPLEITATYRLASEDAIDLEFEVTPQVRMPGFELFLSAYFAEGFDASVYLCSNRFARDDPPAFVPIDHNPLIDGNYLMFPRNREACLKIFDGRWEIPPSPVDWCITRFMAAPLAMRRNAEKDLTVLMMAPPEDCFAVATPYNQEPPDNVANHRSLYLSLFGQDVEEGKTVRARSRLVVAAGLTGAAAVERYEAFIDAEP